MRDEESIVDTQTASTDEVDEDDPYKDFVIPDDLMWQHQVSRYLIRCMLMALKDKKSPDDNIRAFNFGVSRPEMCLHIEDEL